MVVVRAGRFNFPATRPPEGTRAWSNKAHRNWLDHLSWSDVRLQTVFQEYLHALDEIEGRIQRVEAAIHEQATQSDRAPVIQALQTLRGVAEVTCGNQFTYIRLPTVDDGQAFGPGSSRKNKNHGAGHLTASFISDFYVS